MPTNEERMIRVTDDQFHRLSIRFIHENSAKNGEHEMMVAVGMPEELGMKFEELELVPPKKCVYNNENGVCMHPAGACGHCECTYDGKDWWNCEAFKVEL